MKILLIAGHGAGDPGAIGNGYKEADLVREIVPRLKSKLAPYADVTVFDMEKNPYKYLRTHSFNFKEYDYVLEVHFNAFNLKAKGVEILVHTSEKSVGVENAILKRMEALGFTNRGVKKSSSLQNMNICKGKQGVSYALIETCFIDNKEDMTLYNSKKADVINAIAEGIKQGFKLSKVEQSEKTEPTSVEEIVGYLSGRGIITNKELWIKKMADDGDVYWLARKIVNHIASL